MAKALKKKVYRDRPLKLSLKFTINLNRMVKQDLNRIPDSSNIGQNIKAKTENDLSYQETENWTERTNQPTSTLKLIRYNYLIKS